MLPSPTPLTRCGPYVLIPPESVGARRGRPRTRRAPHTAAAETLVTQSARKGLILTAIAVIIIAGLSWKLLKRPKSQEREITGARITKLDSATRTADIEFLHPKSGTDIKLHGTAAPDCEILINDQPATFADLRVGDVATLKGVYSGSKVEAKSVHVRRGTAQSRPASSTAPPASRP